MSTNWDSLPRFKPGNASAIKHLWWKFLPVGCITTIYGESGTGKSPFVLALCDAISQGKEFLGHKTHNKRRVLYLDCENHRQVLQQRITNMRLKMVPDFVLWPDYLKPVPRIHAGYGKTLRKIVKDSDEPVLIVLDHWEQFFADGESGMTPAEAKPMLRNLTRYCGLGATVLIVAHPMRTKPNKLFGWGIEKMDAVLQWKKRNGVMQLTTIRSKLGEYRSFEVVSIKEGEKETGFRLAKDQRVELLREYLRKNATLGKRALCEGAAKFFKSRGLKTNWNAVSDLLDKHTGTEWKIVKHQHGKHTYRLLGGEK